MIILLRGCDFRPRFFLLPALNGVHEIAYRVIRLSYIITGFSTSNFFWIDYSRRVGSEYRPQDINSQSWSEVEQIITTRSPKYSLTIQTSNFQLCSAYICKNICINVYYNTSDLLSKSLFLHFMIFCILKHFYQYYNKFIGYKSATRIIFVSLLVIVI